MFAYTRFSVCFYQNVDKEYIFKDKLEAEQKRRERNTGSTVAFTRNVHSFSDNHSHLPTAAET